MSKIFIDKGFGGIAPRLDPKLLADTMAQVAENVWLARGNLQTLKVPLTTEAIGSGKVSIFKWRRNDSYEWISKAVDTDWVIGPIADDDWDRIYYTNGSTLGMRLWDSGVAVDDDDITWDKPTTPGATLKKFAMPTIYLVNPEGGVTPKVAPASTGWINDYTQYRVVYNVTDILTNGTYVNGCTFSVSTTEGTIVLLGTGTDPIPLYNTAEDAAAETPFGHLSITDQPSWGYTDDYVTATFDIGFIRTSTDYRCYCLSLVDKYGRETPVSDATDLIEVKPNEYVQLEANFTGGAQTKLYFYRSAQGTDAANFFFMGEIVSAAGGSIDDKFSDGELQDVMPYIENPPALMSGLVSLPGGFLAAFHGKEVYFSEPYLPYSWPTKYRITVDHDVVALGVGGNDLYVLTKGTPYYVTGSHPETLTVTKINLNQSCVSKRSVAHVGNTVCYASPDGLVGINGGSARLLTEATHTRADWQAYGPTVLTAAVHENAYFAFFAGTTVIFQLDAAGGIQVTTTTELATGAYADLEDDTLYMIQGSDITAWNSGATNETLRWRTKEFSSMRRLNWSSVRIVADGYPITLRWYAENVLVQTDTITSTTSIRVRKMKPERVWSCELESTNAIDVIAVATSMLGLVP